MSPQARQEWKERFLQVLRADRKALNAMKAMKAMNAKK